MRTPSLSCCCLALLAACGRPAPSGPGLVHDPCQTLAVISPGASPVRSSAIGDAVASWNALGLTRLDTNDTAAADRVEVDFAHAADVFHGYYDPNSGVVDINDQLTDRAALGVVIAHELGHAMGLVHVAPEVRASVMNPGNTTVGPTEADSAAVSAYWSGCR